MTETAWRAFALELAATFPRMANDDAVILEYQGYGVVQFLMDVAPTIGRSRLWVEAFTDARLPEDRKYGSEGEARLRALGWQPPNPPGDENWRFGLAWPFSGGSAWKLALMIIATAREVFRVPGPDTLSYQAFNVSSHADLDFPVLAPLHRVPR